MDDLDYAAPFDGSAGPFDPRAIGGVMSPAPEPSPRIGGLFFGYGGLDMAVQSVFGGALAWVSEIDAGACKVIAHRYPGVPNLGDVTAIDWAVVPHVDILTGGSPCQDVSQAGRRAGMRSGTRSGLWASMREGIAALRPSLVVWENVRGVFTAPADSDLEHCPGCMGDARDGGAVLRALGRVLGDLSDLGYDARWCGLRAADVGAPHGRFRVFVAAYPRGEHGEERRLPASGEAAGGRSFGEPPGRDRAPMTLLPTSQPRLLPTPGAEDGHHGGRGISPERAIRRRDSGRQLGIEETVALLPTPDTGHSLNGHGRRGGKAGNGHQSGASLEHVTDFGPYAAAVERWELLTRPAPPPTEPRADGKPRLNAAFSEWMMGLPDGWVTAVPGITRAEALRCIGNGVVPQQGAAVLAHMISVMPATSNGTEVFV